VPARFALQAIVYGALYTIFWVALPRGRESLMEMLDTLRQLRREER